VDGASHEAGRGDQEACFRARARSMSEAFIAAALLGLLEGLTEFLPVSSTGHMILAVDAFGVAVPPGRVFEVAIQLGAIAAVCVAYFSRLRGVALGLPRDPGARAFATAIVLTTLPAVVIGALAHEAIKSALFRSEVVATALILGGIAILLAERLRPVPRIGTIEKIDARTALLIGCAQCLALVPGVSRSAATVLGAVLMGVERRVAAEFSFFAAIPVLAGAALFDLAKGWSGLSAGDLVQIGIGFTAAFAAALAVVRPFVAFVGRHGFGPFAWYRIALGGAVLAFGAG
jgi:undecaprenyl-diphosphatase